MEGLFITVLKLSTVSCYIIFFVMIVRILLRKMPKIFSYLLWTIVFFKLIFPFSFESVISLIPYQISIQTIAETLLPDSVVSSDQTVTAVTSGVLSTATDTTATNVGGNLTSIISFLTIIWLLGIIVVMIYNMITFLKLKKRLCTAIRIKDNLYETADIHTPFVMGLFRAKIYLPVELGEEERDYIIQHEQVHIQRRDYLIKVIAYLISCIHWFNPLVWLSFLLMNRDMEMSCDEKVIKILGNEIKKEYSSSLLSMVVNQRISSGIPIAFGENSVKTRIKNILSYKKPALWIIIASTCIVAVVCVGLFFDPMRSSSNDSEEIQPIALEELITTDSQISPSDAANLIADEEETGNEDVSEVSADVATNSDVTASADLNNSNTVAAVDEDIQEYLDGPNGKLLEVTTDSFVKAYFSNDKETAFEYLAEDAEYDNYVYKDNNGNEVNVYDKLVHLLAKWYSASDDKANVQYEYEVEGEDSYTYLDISLEYTEGNWVITGIYLEK